MKNFSILSIFLFGLCVSLSVQDEDPNGTGEELNERRLVMTKGVTQQRKVVPQGVFSPSQYFQAPQPSPFTYMQQPGYGYQQVPNMHMQVPSMPSYGHPYQYQHQHQQHYNGYNGFNGLAGVNGLHGLNGLNAYPGYVRNTHNRAYNSPVGCPASTPTVNVGGYTTKPKYTFPGNYGFGMPTTDFGMVPNVVSGLTSGTSFRSNLVDEAEEQN